MGEVSDRLVALGGASGLAEFPELCGAEGDIVQRCATRELKEKFLSLMKNYEHVANFFGTFAGTLGWTSDRRGYRYAALDPGSGRPWPAMPVPFLRLAQEAAALAGFDGFVPDACLINRYRPGTRLSLHQDRDERDFTQPIVSVSLGIYATFLWGGPQRGDRAWRLPLRHGDVVVWGGVDRLRFHGVATVKEDAHPLTGGERINFTFRRAG